jgi:predicted dehydrogenase
MRLRVGVIELGDAWDTRHRTALRSLSDRFEVRAICDQVPHRAEQAAIEFKAQAVDGFRELVSREDLDAVLILGSPWYGPLPILAACESGKAVYCAAGLDLTVDEARRTRAAVEQAGIAFMAEFVRRHAPATLRLKELIATELGAPRLLFCHQRAAAPTRTNHRSPVRTPPAAMRDLVELVDWCCYVVGVAPTGVTGVMHKRGSDGDEDYQMMSLDFSDPSLPATGPVAQISCGRYVPARWTEAINYRPLAPLQVSCERGIAFVDLPNTVVWFDEAGRHQEVLDSERSLGEQMLTVFFRSVTSLVRKTTDLEDTYRALWIVEQARLAHAEGRRIPLADDA